MDYSVRTREDGDRLEYEREIDSYETYFDSHTPLVQSVTGEGGGVGEGWVE
ncbi:hypothetical protein HAL_42840 [Haladaptatus sp. T7]|nr:hypothetical protein HAL_42840 [Haladaptatus sp. T7]